MDKDLVNNQIISMRKNVKSVKRLVKQKLNKQIQRLEQRLKKNASNHKLENKIKHKRNELIAINGVNVDEVSKQSLIESKKHFEDIIRSSQSSPESRALARIASNECIEKVVNKFKKDNPDCEQWLSSQIELWQQKKSLKRNKIMKKKGLLNETESSEKSNEDKPKDNLNPNKTHSKTSKIGDKNENKRKQNEKNKNSNAMESVPKVQTKSEEKVEEIKPKSDPFFLSNDSNSNEDESDHNSDDERKESHSRNKNFDRNKDQKRVRFAKLLGNSYRKPTNAKKPLFRGNKSESKPMPKEKSFKTAAKHRSTREKNLHPSWSAKLSAKDKLKIDLNQKPMAKMIKFE